MGEGRNLPEILPPEDRGLVQVGWWRITPQAATFVRIGTVLSALGVAGWLVQNFLQLRGVVSLLASRIDLALLALSLLIAGFALTIGFQRKRLWRITLAVTIILLAFWVDRSVPRPSIHSETPVAAVEEKPTKIIRQHDEQLAPEQLKMEDKVTVVRRAHQRSDDFRGEIVPHPYDLSNSRRTKFLSLLKPGEGEHDTLRIGCIAWSDSSCVAAGKFLLLFSEAGWVIDSNRVFRAEPMVPTEGMAIVVRVEGELPKLPPHLGTWAQMDASQKTIWKAFREMGVPVSSSRGADLPIGTIGIYFGPEPGPQTVELPLLLSNCEPRGESCDIIASSTDTYGSFITNGNARQVIHVNYPKSVLFQPDASEKQFLVDGDQLPKRLTLGRCGGHACCLTILSFTKTGIVVDSREATVKNNDGNVQGVIVKWNLLTSHHVPLTR